MKDLLKKELNKMMKEKGYTRKSLKVFFEFIFRLIVLLYKFFISRYYFRKCTTGRFVLATGKPYIKNKGEIHIGNRVSIWSNINRTRLSAHLNGKIFIGSDTFINGAFISATNKVRIGNNCKFGPFTMIMDSDFHDISDHNKEGVVEEIVIEDDVWLGARSTVLKGVTVGKGAVVAVGAVVTKDIPPYSIAAGVPAKVIKQINKEE